MKRFTVLLCAVISILCFASVSIAAEFGTAAEAEAMVKKAVAFIKSQGEG